MTPLDTPPWDAAPFPGPFRVPTMLTTREVNYLHWLTSKRCRGEGRVIDLGCFLGGSTMALVTGMEANPRCTDKLLTYDCFVMDALAAESFVHQPYRAGESFRPLFDVHLHRYASRIKVVEGWIPEDLPASGGPTLYPEQAPIEVLFIDAAKTWGVHTTILQCLGPHLIPGVSIVAQQDFKHCWTYWIPVHMHQFREHFRPAHDVPMSCTIGFECTRRLPTDIAPWGPGDIAPDRIDTLWDEIEATFEADGSDHVRATLMLNRSVHLSDAGRHEGSVAALEGLVDWASGRALGALSTLLLPEIRMTRAMLQTRIAAAGPAARHAAERLARLDDTRVAPSSPGLGDHGQWLRSCLWRQAAARCAAAGARRVALYGAGRHTRAMLAAGWPWGAFRVAAIVDDAPTVGSIDGIDVTLPSDMTADIDAVVISSDGHEALLHDAAERAFGSCTLPIVRIYEPESALAAAP